MNTFDEACEFFSITSSSACTGILSISVLWHSVTGLQCKTDKSVNLLINLASFEYQVLEWFFSN